MMTAIRCLALGAGTAAALAPGACADRAGTQSAAPTPAAAEPAEPSIASFTMERIDGAPETLSAYSGRVVLVVNVASECGLTPQYRGLEDLYREKSGEGLVVLGFPANNFGGQEPGSNEQIARFCTDRYDVTFPMFSKISVAGDDQHPLYRELSRVGGPPTWNFTKYLVDRHGRVVARFDPRVGPQDPALRRAIEQALSAG
jgi:glutathione peroxidase